MFRVMGRKGLTELKGFGADMVVLDYGRGRMRLLWSCKERMDGRSRSRRYRL